MLNRVRRISPLTWMVALLLAATFLRLAAWQAAPPGLRYDETTVVYEADEIRAGARPIYMDGSAEEALYHYLFAAAQDFIAPHLFTLRWLSAALQSDRRRRRVRPGPPHVQSRAWACWLPPSPPAHSGR